MMCECGCGQPTRLAPQTLKSRGWVKGKPLRFVAGHNRRKTHVPYIIDENGCWIWQRYVGLHGYGISRGKVAHRVLYEQLVGPIPKGLVLDHLCGVKRCVNPEHLEPVTLSTNTQRAWNRRHCSTCRCNV